MWNTNFYRIQKERDIKQFVINCTRNLFMEFFFNNTHLHGLDMKYYFPVLICQKCNRFPIVHSVSRYGILHPVTDSFLNWTNFVYQYFVMREYIELLLIFFIKRRTSFQELFHYYEVSTWLQLPNILMGS